MDEQVLGFTPGDYRSSSDFVTSARYAANMRDANPCNTDSHVARYLLKTKAVSKNTPKFQPQPDEGLKVPFMVDPRFKPASPILHCSTTSTSLVDY